MRKALLGLAFLLLALPLALCPGPVQAQDSPALSKGGYIYLPIYSDILIGDNARPFPLSVTVCLRNPSLREELTVLAVDYYDSQGNLLKRYLDSPQTIKALGSRTFTVAESEKHGGPGAKCVITWRSAHPMPPLLAESVMIGTSNQQGISFTSRGLAFPPQP